MSHCLNPDCPKPQNPIEAIFCLTCGTKLLLKDRYCATKPLGRGGYSRTFAALDRGRLNHPCVIKLFMMPPEQDRKATELFNQEAVRLYELGKHDQIPELYAHFEQENRLYLVQEFIDGQTLLDELDDKVKSGGSLYQGSEIRDILKNLLPVLNTTISPQIEKILDKLLQVLVKERYQTVDSVLNDLHSPELVPMSWTSETRIDISLESEKRIDYSRLRDFLAAKNWKEADRETRQRMLEVMEQQQRGYLDNEDIEKFPCTDLRTIDRLWVYYSDQRFGFSVQKRIWMDQGGKAGVYNLAAYEKFGEHVGWRVNDSWKLYSDLNFSSNAPLGHLPLGLSIGWGDGAIALVGVEGAVEVDYLFSRVDFCELL